MRVSARFLDGLNYLSATDSYDGARSYQVYDGRHRGEYDYAQQKDSHRKPAVPFQVIKRRAVQRRFLAHLQHQTVVTVGSFVERYLPLGSLVHQPTSGRVSSAAAEFVKRNGETTGQWVGRRRDENAPSILPVNVRANERRPQRRGRLRRRKYLRGHSAMNPAPIQPLASSRGTGMPAGAKRLGKSAELLRFYLRRRPIFASALSLSHVP